MYMSASRVWPLLRWIVVGVVRVAGEVPELGGEVLSTFTYLMIFTPREER